MGNNIQLNNKVEINQPTDRDKVAPKNVLVNLADSADWDGLPATQNEAFDQLASRTRDLEEAGISVQSGSYTITDTDGVKVLLVDDTSSDRTITLPTLADNQGRVLTVQNISSNKGNVTLDGEGSETISGSLSIDLPMKDSYTKVIATASEWVTLDIHYPEKQYDLTVTATGWTISRAIGVPYVVWDNTSQTIKWRMKINFDGSHSGVSGTTTFAVTGVTFSSGFTARGQAVACDLADLGVLDLSASLCLAAGGTGNIVVRGMSPTAEGVTIDNACVSGDIELASKPTFVI